MDKDYTYQLHKKDKTVKILSGDDQVLGFYKITSKTKYDIIIPNGVVNDWEKGQSSREWKYSVNGSEVMNCKFIKEDGKKYLQYTILNPGVPDFSNAFLISKIYGADLIQTKASAPVVYGGVIAGAVAISLLNYAQPDPTPKVD